MEALRHHVIKDIFCLGDISANLHPLVATQNILAYWVANPRTLRPKVLHGKGRASRFERQNTNVITTTSHSIRSSV